MKKRPRTATVHVSTRLREPLRAKLEAAAKRSGVSLNKELNARLEQTFTQDAAYGGAEIRHFANLMAASFALEGKRAGADKGIAEWTTDSDAYFAAVSGVVRSLLRHAPAPFTPTQVAALKSLGLTISPYQGKGE